MEVQLEMNEDCTKERSIKILIVCTLMYDGTLVENNFGND